MVALSVSKCNDSGGIRNISESGGMFLYPRNDVPIVPYPMSGKMRNESSARKIPRVNSGRR